MAMSTLKQSANINISFPFFFPLSIRHCMHSLSLTFFRAMLDQPQVQWIDNFSPSMKFRNIGTPYIASSPYHLVGWTIKASVVSRAAEASPEMKKIHNLPAMPDHLFDLALRERVRRTMAAYEARTNVDDYFPASISRNVTRIPIKIVGKTTAAQRREVVDDGPLFVAQGILDLNISNNKDFLKNLLVIREQYEQGVMGNNYVMMVMDQNIYDRTLKVENNLFYKL